LLDEIGALPLAHEIVELRCAGLGARAILVALLRVF